MQHERVTTESGFTLLEIMLVIAIISILAVASYGSYQRYVSRSSVVELVTNIDAMREAFGVEMAENGDITKFTFAGEGNIPSELSSLGISPELIQYSDLGLSFTFMSFRGDKARPYLVLASKDDLGSASLSALAEVLPDRTFFWMSEPTVAMVPMTEFNAFSGVNLPLPQTSIAVPQPAVATTTSQPTQSAAIPGAAKLHIPSQDLLDTISTVVNGGINGLRPETQATLAEDLQDLQAAVYYGDQTAAEALSAKLRAFVNHQDFSDQVDISVAISLSRNFTEIWHDIAVLGLN